MRQRAGSYTCRIGFVLHDRLLSGYVILLPQVVIADLDVCIGQGFTLRHRFVGFNLRRRPRGVEDDIDAMRVQLVQHPLGTGVPCRGLIPGDRLH